MDGDNLNKASIAKALNFHGPQLHKILETEHPNFQNLKLDPLLNFNEYTKRQKNMNFQDRGKRFRVQQFIGKHADKLFPKTYTTSNGTSLPNSSVNADLCPIMPPLEWFTSVDKEFRLQRFFEYLKEGNIIVATVLNKTSPGIILKLLYGECDEIRCVSDIGIKAFCPTPALIPALDKKSNSSRAFLINDIVCCEVLEVCSDTEKIVCGMKGVRCQTEDQTRLGLMNSEDFSPVFRKFQEKRKDATYISLLTNSENFYNPSFVSSQLVRLGVRDELYSNFTYLKEKFPEKECASELRQLQASKWSFRSVAEGIEHFKSGRYTEAFQCLNKALSIDPKNIEALVARGALYANSSSYEKAISDFQVALKFNCNHQNAKKYLGDTYIAFGKTHEENSNFEDAVKAYESCLNLIPNHEEARNSLQFIKNRMQAALKEENDESSLDAKKLRDINNTLCQLLSQTDDKHLIRELKKLKKKRTTSSSSSSSSSDSSSDSSNSSTSSSDSSVVVKKRKKHKKENSLSPLSKRMALMEGNSFKGGFQSLGQISPTYKPTVPYLEDKNLAVPSYHSTHDFENEYELRVKKFLEETKRDSDYEEKVQKFLEETAKWKKKQKSKEVKKKKKKEKLKYKKKKKDSKKKKKKDDKKHKKHSSGSATETLESNSNDKYLNLSSLKELENLQNKLSKYYSKVEKVSSKNKKDKYKDKEERSFKHKLSESDEKYEDEDTKHSEDKEKPESYEDDETPYEGLNPGSFVKFKMQVPKPNKVQKRDTEDPFWQEEKNQSEDETANESTKENSKNLTESTQYPKIGMNVTAGSSNSTNMDKLRGFHVKRADSRSPKRGSYRSKSRSKSVDGKRYRSRSRSKKRYSRSRSRSDSYHRDKYSRYSRSRSYSKSNSRSRSRSPYYRNRNYRSRGRGTYYKPRISSYRGSSYRGNWRNNYNGRNRGYSSRSRNRRPYYRPYKHRDDRDYRRRRSSDENSDYRDSSRERSVKRHSDNDYKDIKDTKEIKDIKPKISSPKYIENDQNLDDIILPPGTEGIED